MAEDTRAVSEAPTIRAYLAPAQHWALPLRHDFTQDPQTPLDHGLAEQAADERVAVRFILEPAREAAKFVSPCTVLSSCAPASDWREAGSGVRCCGRPAARCGRCWPLG